MGRHASQKTRQTATPVLGAIHRALAPVENTGLHGFVTLSAKMSEKMSFRLIFGVEAPNKRS
eukprot:1415178-Prymnesium_polylepis.1